MVRCEQFYEYWERKGNFCGKSDVVAKKVEEYIEYVKRTKLLEYSGFKISHCALDPFISIEKIKNGKVHNVALRDLKSLIRKGKVLPEKITRRISVEIINKANNKVAIEYQITSIPNIRNRMKEHEHDINNLGFEVRSTFDELKKDLGVKNNNEAIKIMLEMCIRNPEEIRKIKVELDSKKETDQNVEIVTTT